MKIILTMATSVNGIIARTTGSEDFLSHTNWLQFVKFANKVGCFMWGRKTYEAVSKWEGDYLSELKDVKKIIISRSQIDLLPGFELANSPEEALSKLESYGFSKAIITGGAIMNSEFASRNLIDEVVLDINPALLGEGVPLFQPASFHLNLQLVSAEKISDGIVEVKYSVKK